MEAVNEYNGFSPFEEMTGRNRFDRSRDDLINFYKAVKLCRY